MYCVLGCKVILSDYKDSGVIVRPSPQSRNKNAFKSIEKEGEQKVFCSPSFGLSNPRRLTSATPIRGISRPRRGPFGTFRSATFFIAVLGDGFI